MTPSAEFLGFLPVTLVLPNLRLQLLIAVPLLGRNLLLRRVQTQPRELPGCRISQLGTGRFPPLGTTVKELPAEPKARSLTRLFSCWQVAGLRWKDMRWANCGRYLVTGFSMLAMAVFAL